MNSFSKLPKQKFGVKFNFNQTMHVGNNSRSGDIPPAKVGIGLARNVTEIK